MNDSSAVPPPDPDHPRHPIRVVAERTGLTPATLRAWERRYGVVEPGRSEGGQRLYSDGDVERLVLLRRVTDAGRAISSVAEFSTRRLEGMAAEDEAARASLPNPSTAALTVPPSTALTLALQAVERLDPKGLERLLRREVILMGGEAFLDDLVTPLLREIGSRWRGGTLRPAHEHAAVAVIKQILGWMLERAREDASGRMLVVGTLAGEQHELGALLAATVAAMEGWQVLFLGHDLPPEEIALTVRSVNASAVGISVVNPVDFDGIPGQLQRLLEGLPAGALVILGGAAAEDVVRVAGDDRIIALPSLKEFRRALRNQD
jgi:DNA-binding transcriptional MerR regulator/methylmalonyl-CoA mutase cobalamin-binding subunit